jgi:bacillaene synthase trans-acting acyltransferase
MNTKTLFMFSGQGSQYFLMGQQLYEENRTFRYWMDYCSDITKSNYDFDLIMTIYRPRADRFEPFYQTSHTGPAIFAINYSMAQTLIAEGIYPDGLLGYSLGEITALTMSGYLNLEDGLHLLNRSMRIFEEKTGPASMMAILSSPEICNLYRTEFQPVAIASFNFDRGFVVTGYTEVLEYLQEFLQRKEILTQMLPVSHGFHSSIIDPAEIELRKLFRSLKLGKGSIPVVSSVYGRYLGKDDLTENYYWNLARQPVEFYKTVQMIEKSGPCLYIDAGPSGTLAAFVKYIVGEGADSKSVPVIDKFGLNIRNLHRARELSSQICSRSGGYANV